MQLNVVIQSVLGFRSVPWSLRGVSVELERGNSHGFDEKSQFSCLSSAPVELPWN